MSYFQLQQLTRQNKRLKERLSQQESSLKCSKNDCQTYLQIIDQCKAEKSSLQHQIKELKRREQEKNYERDDMESRYLNVLKKMEDQLDERKRKYQKLQSKIQPLVNHDTVRLKILNEVSASHQMEMDQYKRSIDSLKDQLLKVKRQNQLLKHRLQTQKLDHEEQLRKIKSRYQNSLKNDHFNEVTYEMCMEIENRLRMNYEQAKKQSDYYKQKYFTSEKKNQQKLAKAEKELFYLKEQVRMHDQ